jgi:hypothetical protein
MPASASRDIARFEKRGSDDRVVTVCGGNVTARKYKEVGEYLKSRSPSPNIVTVIKPRRIRRAGQVARMTDTLKCIVKKSQGKRPFGRPRYRSEGNTKMDLRDSIGSG